MTDDSLVKQKTSPPTVPSQCPSADPARVKKIFPNPYMEKILNKNIFLKTNTNLSTALQIVTSYSWKGLLREVACRAFHVWKSNSITEHSLTSVTALILQFAWFLLHNIHVPVKTKLFVDASLQHKMDNWQTVYQFTTSYSYFQTLRVRGHCLAENISYK